ncbi:uncharacterized protein LOC121602640 isoform X2 [Anopheles merus]|uniref:uncharacterized protein LOC121602640 isoform X2 n=1 Tax=Anopheles merus TaxID=30066 RepID=UPI001BE4CBEC|nr:uncharacterized protein LOC121602640 isoform X2 [Anopheles merus]
MMARGGAGPGSTMQLLLVRLLLLGLVLLVILNGVVVAAGSVRATARQTTATVAEDEDSSSSSSSAAVGGSSDEMLEESEESFEQDASSSGETPTPSRHESAESTTERGGAPDEDDDDGSVTGTTLGYSAVATTPKIVVRPVKQLSRYEQGLEDYDEAADRAEREQQQQQQQQQEQSVDQQYNNMVKPMLTLFNVISTVLSSGRSMRTVTAGWERPAADDTERPLATTDDGNPGNKSEIITAGEKSTSGPSDGTAGGATAEGRYIKGDPLNGYYDFIISEGSYKFWAVFQLVTAAVVIYSTLTAIYYSKVAPLTADYDYIDYLNGGRSFAGARPLDETGSRSAQTSGRRASGWMDNLSSSSWFGPAAQGFTIVMEAIERQQKW